jgi:hypothetical protein
VFVAYNTCHQRELFLGVLRKIDWRIREDRLEIASDNMQGYRTILGLVVAAQDLTMHLKLPRGFI